MSRPLPHGAQRARLPWTDAELWLLPQRAAYCPCTDSLLVADVHLGKAASFRRLGVPVPEATTEGTLARLDAALVACGARRLVVLGDLLHAPAAREGPPAAAFLAWRRQRPGLEIVRVEGNHDLRAGALPEAWDVQAVGEPWTLGPWSLAHHPSDITSPHRTGYPLAGHVHPAVRVGRGPGGGLRLPCFWFSVSGGVLPAFGEFTGSHVIQPAADDCLWLAAGDAVRAGPVPARHPPLTARSR